MISEAMRTYFSAETIAVWFFTFPGGLLVIAGGVAALRSEWSGFHIGLGGGCILLGLAMVSYAVAVHIRTPSQIETVQIVIEQQSEIGFIAELDRMRQHVKGLEGALMAFGIVGVIGLFLYFVLKQEWAVGLGSALVLAAGITFVTDGVGLRRAQTYIAALEKVINAPSFTSTQKLRERLQDSNFK